MAFIWFRMGFGLSSANLMQIGFLQQLGDGYLSDIYMPFEKKIMKYTEFLYYEIAVDVQVM